MTPDLDELHEQFSRLFETQGMSAPAVPAPSAPEPAPAADGSVVPAAPVEPVVGPVRKTDFAVCGYHLDVTVPPERVIEAVTIADRAGFGMDTISGVDWPEQEQMEVVYDFFHPLGSLRVVVRARIPRAHPVIASISSVFAGANWHEREAHEFYGIDFTGHPNLNHLLLPEDMKGFPLRKDFKDVG